MKSRNKTHNETAIHFENVLLQGYLPYVSARVRMISHRTNLIVNHHVTDIFYQAAESICIIRVLEEPSDLALLFQQLELFVNAFYFPFCPHLLNLFRIPGIMGLPFRNTSPQLFHDMTFRSGHAEQFCKRLDLGCQQFYQLLIHVHLLTFL